MLDFSPGTEPDLSLLDCGRCGEPMLHQVIGLSAHFPLCILWYVACGECGYEAQAWEDRPTLIRYGGGKQQILNNPQEEEVESAFAEFKGEEEE